MREPDGSDSIYELLSRERLDVIRDILLTPNRSCPPDDGHFLCWHVRCRHCAESLRDHTEAQNLSTVIGQLRAVHLCRGRTSQAGAA